MALVIGVDSSTQSTKLEARDAATGRLAAASRAPHPPVSPPRSEQDPEAWWNALIEERTHGLPVFAVIEGAMAALLRQPVVFCLLAA